MRQGSLDDLDATLVSEVYKSRPSSIYSFYSIEYKQLQESQIGLKLIENISVNMIPVWQFDILS